MLASDDPGWWRRSEERRPFCLPRSDDRVGIVMLERGAPCLEHSLNKHFDGTDVFKASHASVKEYLQATGLAGRPDWVYGVGARAVWPDGPGRWFLVHAATAALLEAGRAQAPGTFADNGQLIRWQARGGSALSVIRRQKGEPAPGAVDVQVAALRYSGLEPERCYGIGSTGIPTITMFGDRVTELTMDSQGILAVVADDQLGWWDGFLACRDLEVPFGPLVDGPRGPIAVVRLDWALGVRPRVLQGDTAVPASPIELAVAYLETVGVEPQDCWGVSESLGGGEPFAQILYRPGPGDAEGRERFASYARALRIDPVDLEVPNYEGHLSLSGPRAQLVRPGSRTRKPR